MFVGNPTWIEFLILIIMPFYFITIYIFGFILFFWLAHQISFDDLEMHEFSVASNNTETNLNNHGQGK
jgi:ACR3 family arsenite efflux pump ArsB